MDPQVYQNLHIIRHSIDIKSLLNYVANIKMHVLYKILAMNRHESWKLYFSTIQTALTMP
jgi:hypothetical protein